MKNSVATKKSSPTKLSEANKDQLMQLIKVWSTLSGVSQQLTMNELGVLVDFIREDIGHLGIKFMDSAVRSFAKGEFDLQHYGSFSAAFVGQLVKHQKEILRKKNLVNQQSVPQLPEHYPSAEDEERKSFEFIQRVFNKTGKLPLAGLYKQAFKYAEKTGLISLTNEQKQAYKEEARLHIESEERRIAREEGRRHSPNVSETAVKHYCYKTKIKEYLENA